MSKISLQRKDYTFNDLIEPMEKITKFIILNRDLLDIYSEVLIGVNKNKSNFNRELKECFDLYYEINDKDDRIKELHNLFETFYLYVDDPQYDLVLKANYSFYQKDQMYDGQHKLNKFRGLLFESLVESLVKDRYTQQFNTGCTVSINGKEIIYEASNRKTVDVAGIKDDKVGEFYECKVTPNSLDNNSYQYLNILEFELNKLDEFERVVGCVSIGSQERISAKKQIIENDLGINNDYIEMIGIENIFNLIQFPTAFHLAV